MEQRPTTGAGPETTGNQPQDDDHDHEPLELFAPEHDATQALGNAAMRAGESGAEHQEQPRPAATRAAVRGRRLEGTCAGPVDLVWRPREQQGGGTIVLGGRDEF